MKTAPAKATLKTLERRLRTILPEEYKDRYEEVQPVSMGSAGLKYGDDGRVAWNEMWASFCDLAMAGGPPHKGTLLEPGRPTDIDAQPLRYQQVVEEICRGIALVFGLPAGPAPDPGWVRVICPTWGMTEWLARAIAMENVSVRCCEGSTLDLPAGPAYRVEKEIKNVITAMAKTCHYWTQHMPAAQRRAIADLFATMEEESPLLQPDYNAPPDKSRQLRSSMADTIHQATGLHLSDHSYTGWLGVVCPDVRAAIWMMRLLVASNLLSRREDTVVFLPINPLLDPTGEIVTQTIVRIHGFAVKRNILFETRDVSSSPASPATAHLNRL
jgi:sirohydrochlorin cobaltochelatase